MATPKPENTVKLNLTLKGRAAALFKQALPVYFGPMVEKYPDCITRRDWNAMAAKIVESVLLEMVSRREFVRPLAITLRKETEAETAARLDWQNQQDELARIHQIEIEEGL